MQEAAGEPKVGEQGAASFRTDAVRLARTPSSVNQSDSDEILGPHTYTEAKGLASCRQGVKKALREELMQARGEGQGTAT